MTEASYTLDVKPGNVLWCPYTDQLKVCDFGMSENIARLAKPAASPRFAQYVTAAYRPPELQPVSSARRIKQ